MQKVDPEVMTLFCTYFLACVTGKIIENERQRQILTEKIVTAWVG